MINPEVKAKETAMWTLRAPHVMLVALAMVINLALSWMQVIPKPSTARACSIPFLTIKQIIANTPVRRKRLGVEVQRFVDE